MDAQVLALAIVYSIIGAGFGAFALFAPARAAVALRLRAVPDSPGGFAEFRAAFGAMFLFSHLGFLVAAWFDQGVIGAAAILALIWGGAAVGRIMSIILDADRGVRTRRNYLLASAEIMGGLAYAVPVMDFIYRGP